jgi:hypothetical protein
VPHLSLQDLLELEDAGPRPEAREHLAWCHQCATEQKALAARRARLRALPEVHPSTDRWPAIERALRVDRRRRQVRSGALAMAAAIAFLVVASAVWRQPAPPTPTPLAEKPVEKPVGKASELAQLIDRSDSLEAKLRRLPDPSTLSIGAAATLVDLEDRLAFIDKCIEQLRRGSGSPEEISALYKTRLEILEELISRRKPPVALVSL